MKPNSNVVHLIPKTKQHPNHNLFNLVLTDTLNAVNWLADNGYTIIDVVVPKNEAGRHKIPTITIENSPLCTHLTVIHTETFTIKETGNVYKMYGALVHECSVLWRVKL